MKYSENDILWERTSWEQRHLWWKVDWVIDESLDLILMANRSHHRAGKTEIVQTASWRRKSWAVERFKFSKNSSAAECFFSPSSLSTTVTIRFQKEDGQVKL